MLWLLIFVVLVLALLPSWPYSRGWGYYPSGGLGVLLIVLILFLMGAIVSGAMNTNEGAMS